MYQFLFSDVTLVIMLMIALITTITLSTWSYLNFFSTTDNTGTLSETSTMSKIQLGLVITAWITVFFALVLIIPRAVFMKYPVDKVVSLGVLSFLPLVLLIGLMVFAGVIFTNTYMKYFKNGNNDPELKETHKKYQLIGMIVSYVCILPLILIVAGTININRHINVINYNRIGISAEPQGSTKIVEIPGANILDDKVGPMRIEAQQQEYWKQIQKATRDLNFVDANSF